MTEVFERAKTVHAIECAAIVIGEIFDIALPKTSLRRWNQVTKEARQGKYVISTSI
jgi:hypothetical protein